MAKIVLILSAPEVDQFQDLLAHATTLVLPPGSDLHSLSPVGAIDIVAVQGAWFRVSFDAVIA